MLGLEVVATRLVGDRREEAADEAHVVVPRQPADHAVVLSQVDAGRVAIEVVQQRLVRNRDAGRETGRAAGILQVADIVGRELREGRLPARRPWRIPPSSPLRTLAARRRPAPFRRSRRDRSALWGPRSQAGPKAGRYSCPCRRRSSAAAAAPARRRHRCSRRTTPRIRGWFRRSTPRGLRVRSPRRSGGEPS